MTASPSAPTFDATLLAAGRLRTDYAGGVLTITLDRPEIRNAQLPQTWQALAHIGSRLPGETRVVIVRGAGASFSAGLDRSAFAAGSDSLLSRLARQPGAVADEQIAGFQAGFSWLSDPAFISVAAVSGHAIGAGFQLALACDLVLVADDAQFSMAEVTLGLTPDLGGTGRLIGAVGRQRALEICVTGRRVGAAEAVRIGIALMSVPAADLGEAVADLVAALTAPDANTVRAVSRLISGAAERSIGQQLAAERDEQIGRLRALMSAVQE